MPKYPFLSDEWVEEARRIYAQAEVEGPLVDQAQLAPARINLVVNDAPFADGPLRAHVDTSGGRLHIDTGHVEKADVTVSMGYETARALFVAGDAQAVMQAFLGGRIRVDGDLSKLLDPRSGIFPANPGAGIWGAPPMAVPGRGAGMPGAGPAGPQSAGPQSAGLEGAGAEQGGTEQGPPEEGHRDRGASAPASEAAGQGHPAASQPRLGSALGGPGAHDIAAQLQAITE